MGTAQHTLASSTESTQLALLPLVMPGLSLFLDAHGNDCAEFCLVLQVGSCDVPQGNGHVHRSAECATQRVRHEQVLLCVSGMCAHDLQVDLSLSASLAWTQACGEWLQGGCVCARARVCVCVWSWSVLQFALQDLKIALANTPSVHPLFVLYCIVYYKSVFVCVLIAVPQKGA